MMYDNKKYSFPRLFSIMGNTISKFIIVAATIRVSKCQDLDLPRSADTYY